MGVDLAVGPIGHWAERTKPTHAVGNALAQFGDFSLQVGDQCFVLSIESGLPRCCFVSICVWDGLVNGGHPTGHRPQAGSSIGVTSRSLGWSPRGTWMLHGHGC